MNKKYLDDANTLISYFKKQVKQVKNVDIVVNRNKTKYNIAEILYDFSPAEVRRLIDYYVKTYKEPDLIQFCYSYEEIHKEMITDEQDDKDRLALAKETRKRVEEFRKQYGGNQ